MHKPRYTFEPIENLLTASVVSKALLESLRLRLYDLLETPQSVSQIAQATGTDESAMETFLRLLEGRELVTRVDGGYVNTPIASEFLVSTSPFYQGKSIRMQQANYAGVVENMPRLLECPGKARGNIGLRFATNEAIDAVLQYALRGSLQDAVDFMIALPGFSHFRRMCDIGGNHGRYSMALLDRNPNLSAVIADLLDVTHIIETRIADAGYQDRLSTTACDLRKDDLPTDAYDLVLTSHVLQIFTDNLDAVLAKIGASVAPGGWFVSQNMNLTARASSGQVEAIDLATCLTMKIRHTIGREELEAGLRKAGFGDFIVGHTGPGRQNLIVAGRKN